MLNPSVSWQVLKGSVVVDVVVVLVVVVLEVVVDVVVEVVVLAQPTIRLTVAMSPLW
jgi:hypothetical protein